MRLALAGACCVFMPMALAADGGAPFPTALKMLLPVLLFLLLAASLNRLGRWAGARWPAGRALALAEHACLVLCLAAIATVLVLAQFKPAMLPADQRAIPSRDAHLALGAALLAVACAPLAWRGALRLVAPDIVVRLRSLGAPAWQVALLCLLSLACVATFGMLGARLGAATPGVFGLLQFNFMALFLLTVPTALRWLRGILASS